MPNNPTKINISSIRDNHNRGSIGQFLADNVSHESSLSVVSAYFTIYAYAHLKDQFNRIKHFRFLFGEPAFIKSIDPSKSNKRDFKIEDDKIVIPLESRLTQKAVAKECAEWLRQKADIKSMVKTKLSSRQDVSYTAAERY